MLWFLFFLITIVFIESAIFSWIWGLFGSWLTIGGVFASAIAGVAIVRQQGLVVILKLRDKSKDAQLLGIEFIVSVCISIAGAVLIIPGFLTDFLGTLLLIGPLRHSVGASIMRKSKWGKPSGLRQSTNTPTTIDGEFHEVNNSEHTQ